MHVGAGTVVRVSHTLEWVDVPHFNIEHPHVHVAMRRIKADGSPLDLKRESSSRSAPALVEAKSRELIALFGDIRRFVLNAGCAIAATAPEASIRAMVHAARSW
jgi:hypothetical protein